MTVQQRHFDAAEQIRAEHERQIQSIRERRALTDEAKAALAYRVHKNASQAMAALQETAVQETKTQRSAAEQHAFGVVGLEGDSASLAISFRDALDRAAQVSSPADAMALLARANRSGDEPLARAIAGHAHDMTTSGLGRMDPGWHGVVASFAETRPELIPDINDLTTLSAPVATARELFAFVLPAPPEIDGRNPAQLEALLDEVA